MLFAGNRVYARRASDREPNGGAYGFSEDGVLENLKDLVTKGPAGMANERIKESLAHVDEFNKLDRSDPEAMKRYMAQQNAQVQAQLNSHFMTRNVVSGENMAHLQQLQNNALEDSTAMRQMLNEHKAKQAATGGAAAESAASAAGGSLHEPAGGTEWPPRSK